VTWVKLDDGLPNHAKVADLSDAAFRTYITSLCFCSSALTDGELTDGQLKRLARPKADRQELLDAGLWEPREGGGVVIHDFLHYQPSRAQVQARRKADSERAVRHRDLQRERNAVTEPLQPRDGHADVTPLPSRPVPTPPIPDQDPDKIGTRPKRARPVEPPSGDHRRVVDTYFRAFEARRKTKPKFGAREGKAAKELLESLGVEGACDLLDRVYTSEFWSQNQSIVSIAKDPSRFGAPTSSNRNGRSEKVSALFERAERMPEESPSGIMPRASPLGLLGSVLTGGTEVK
jgi:hypothetical protein